MATKYARNQILYAGSGVPTPVSEGRGFKITRSTDLLEDTSWGDSSKSYNVGLSDFKGALTKWYDTAAFVCEAAALAGTVMKFYWYPDRATVTDYWYWTGYLTSMSQGGDIGAMIEETYDIVADNVVAPTHIHA
jgi:hypothetical protein